MADITADLVAGSKVGPYSEANRRVVSFAVATVEDGDTFVVNDLPEGIAYATAVIEDASADAADAANVASVSGKTITFNAAGTARTVRVTAHGRSAQGGVNQ